MNSNKTLSRFRFDALDSTGARVSGTEMALTAGAAHLALFDRGYQPLEVSERKSLLQFEITTRKIPRKEIMHFSRQLSVFMTAGNSHYGSARSDRA